MAQPFRLREPASGERELSFVFNGRKLQGRSGDTLAAALLANGIHFVGRSFKYHRPRGILSSGVEEPNALVQLGRDAHTEPNLRATEVELFEGLVAESQNAWPSLGFDLRAINRLFAPLIPVGFYYKTFMWPRKSWMFYEKHIRRAAGLGKAPREPDPDRYEHVNRHCDVLVVGGGPAGLAATLAAGRAGARVILADLNPSVGGSLLSEPADSPLRIDGLTPREWVRGALAELAAMPEVTVLTRTMAFGRYSHGWFGLVEKVADHLGPQPAIVRQRLWRIRARHAILATGSIERALVFENNDLPGVMLAGAVQDYAVRYDVAVGRNVVVAANNDSAYRSAFAALSCGVRVTAVVDPRPSVAARLREECARHNVELLVGHSVVRAHGQRRVKACDVAPLHATRAKSEGGRRRLACDVIAMSGGFAPAVHLHSQAQGSLVFREADGVYLPAGEASAPVSVGACAGEFDLARALSTAGVAGAQAAAEADFAARPVAVRVEGAFEAALQTAWNDGAWSAGDPARSFVDYQNDVTVKDLGLAIREGFEINEHLKRYTGTGMGTDQGKVGNLNALSIAATIRGLTPQEVGLTRYRQPFSPVALGPIAGAYRDGLLLQVRNSPLHAEHWARGAVFEPQGAWRVPAAFPASGESLSAAVAREARDARHKTGLFDLSAAGKVELAGPDCAQFIDRLYCNATADLQVGAWQTGLMQDENGILLDRNEIFRLSEARYLLTTGASRADHLFLWLETWLQQGWPDLKVHVTDVTEAWGCIGLTGKGAVDVLASILAEFGGSGALPPSNGFTEAGSLRVAALDLHDMPGFLLQVPADQATETWRAALDHPDVVPCGSTAWSVLESEAGWLQVGHEIDGTVNAYDLGARPDLRKPDFIGRRSLLRPDSDRPDRAQLVRLVRADPNALLPPGAQVVREIDGRAEPVGYVTSAVFSPGLNRAVNNALVQGGRGLVGKMVEVVGEDMKVEARVEEPSTGFSAPSVRREARV